MVRLRPTTSDDLDFVLALEHRPGQDAFIGQWTRDQHLDAIARPDREHWTIADVETGALLGYIITYDMREAGYGVYVKRIAVAHPSRGIGRDALHQLVTREFGDRQAALVCLAVRTHNARAQRAYAAIGFAEWPLPHAAHRAFTAAVDPGAMDCLLMRVTPVSLRAPAAAGSD